MQLTIDSEKLKFLEKQVVELQEKLKNYAVHLKARQQAASELFESNINLGARNFALDDALKTLEGKEKMLLERISTLEKLLDEKNNKIPCDPQEAA